MESNSTQAQQPLQKLSAINSEEALDKLLSALWKSRKSGLPHPDKSNLQSLLRLPSLSDVDPVVASLRAFIGKCLREDYSGNDILRLLPPGLSVDLQSTFVTLLHKYQVQWKEEMARDQHSLPRTNLPYQASTTALSSLISFPSSEISMPLWPRHDDPAVHLNQSDFLGSIPMIADSLHLGAMTNQHDVCPPDSVLLDYSKSPVGEMEVKFQLTRDTLEAMLRSLSYISNQFSRIAGSSSGPMQKKQKQ
ncbi:hypothetical protein Ancab_033222 [Ancistrocladus abbreviatus]